MTNSSASLPRCASNGAVQMTSRSMDDPARYGMTPGESRRWEENSQEGLFFWFGKVFVGWKTWRGICSSRLSGARWEEYRVV